MSESTSSEYSELKLNLKGHKKPITSLSFEPDGRQFASSSEDHTIMIWNLQQSRQSYSFNGHSDIVTDVAYAPNGKLLASCSQDKTVRIWVPTLTGTSVEFKAHTAPIRMVGFTPDSDKIITGSNDKSLKLWNVAHKKFLSSFVGHTNWVQSADFSIDGQMLVSCAADRSVKIWDVGSGECVHTFQTSKANPTCVSLQKTGTAVAVAMESGSLRIYDTRMRKLQQHYVLHDSTTSACWHPRANYVLSSGKDGKMIIVDVLEGRPLYTLTGHEGAVSCVKFSSDGEYFASAGADRHIMVWKTNFC